MLQIKTEIQGFSFIQADVHGCYLPSRASIESVLEKVYNKTKKQKICAYSNRLVRNLDERSDIPSHLLDMAFHIILSEYYFTGQFSLEDLDKLILKTIRDQCQLSGYDFDIMMQNMFVEMWFNGLVGDSNHDIQKQRKMTSRWLGCTYGNSRSNKKYTKPKPEAITQRMMEYPEYVISRKFVESFYCRINEIALYDQRMRQAVADHFEFGNKQYEILEKSKNKTRTFFCGKCQTHFTSKRMPSLKICV
jgi:hypothetical protein